MSREKNKIIAGNVLRDCIKLKDRRLKIHQFFEHTEDIKLPEKEYSPDVQFWNMDTFEACRELIQSDFNPVGHNMSSVFKVGGGWLNGASAQEESLFRHSSYCLSLSPYVQRTYYPMYKGLIYSPHVLVFKDDHGKDLRNPYEVSMIACPAIRNPVLSLNGKYKKKDYDKMYSKIEDIIRLALSKGHDSIVLSAFGCGAYHNPPEDVCHIFSTLLKIYAKNFRRVVFAILDSGTGNFNYFKNNVEI